MTTIIFRQANVMKLVIPAPRQRVRPPAGGGTHRDRRFLARCRQRVAIKRGDY